MLGRHGMGWMIGAGLGLMIGCRGETDSGRVPLHGSVRVEGARVTEGSLSLLPAQGHSGPAASTSIGDGKYAFTTATGPVAGPHRAVVGVSATDETAATDASTAWIEDRNRSDAAIKSPPEGGPPASFASPAQWELEFDVPNEGDYRADLDFGASRGSYRP